MGVKLTDLEGGGCLCEVTGTLARRLRRAAKDLKTTPEAVALAALNAEVGFSKQIEKGRKEVRRANRPG